MRFDSTIPSGSQTCHFTAWKASPEEKAQWEAYTRLLEKKALEHAQKETPGKPR